jgi:hypothetical protein
MTFIPDLVVRKFHNELHAIDRFDGVRQLMEKILGHNIAFE